MAPRGPSSAPASAASSPLGVTPRPRTTRSASIEVSAEVDPARFEPGDVDAEPHVDAEPLHRRQEARRHVGVERVHDLVAAFDEGDGRAAPDERLGHLQSDVAAADHHDLVAA